VFPQQKLYLLQNMQRPKCFTIVTERKYPFRIADEFLDISIPSTRKNSQTIRRLLYDTIDHEFGRDLEIASDKLSQATKVTSDRRAYDKVNMSADSLSRMVRDETFITFAVLNALAKYYHIPMSALLLFTRIRDEMEANEYRKSNDARNLLVAMQETIVHLEKVVDSKRDAIGDALDHQTFLGYVSVFQKVQQDQKEQPELAFFQAPKRRKDDEGI
jgi:hypothetical protein